MSSTPDPRVSPRFVGIRSFARFGLHDGPLDDVDVAIIGLPFDTSVVYRPGARFAPAAIRDASVLLRSFSYDGELDVFGSLNIVDRGDAPVIPGQAMRSLEIIEQAVTEIVSNDVMPVGLGGDHLVTLAELRAVAAKHGPVGLLQVDAHTDTDDSYFGDRYTHGSSFVRAVEEGIVDSERLVQVGLRGSLFEANDYDLSRRLGFDTITASEVDHIGVDATAERVRERLGEGPVFITFDIDGLDPSCAPGTGMPEIGGLSYREAQRLLRSLHTVDLVGCDLVEVLPAYDPTEITAIAAANIVFEMLCIKAARSKERRS